MPKVQPEYLEQRRQQILDAAAACFTRTGFHQTTMQDICTEADLSPGAVYRYFRSKDEIIQAMCLRGTENEAGTIREIMDLGSTADVFDELARVYLENVANHEMCVLSIELLAESRRDPVVLEAVRSGSAAAHAALADIVRQAQQRGDLSDSFDPEALARVLDGLYEGLIWQKMVEPELDTAPYANAVRMLFGAAFEQARQPAGQLQPAVYRH